MCFFFGSWGVGIFYRSLFQLNKLTGCNLIASTCQFSTVITYQTSIHDKTKEE